MQASNRCIHIEINAMQAGSNHGGKPKKHSAQTRKSQQTSACHLRAIPFETCDFCHSPQNQQTLKRYSENPNWNDCSMVAIMTSNPRYNTPQVSPSHVTTIRASFNTNILVKLKAAVIPAPILSQMNIWPRKQTWHVKWTHDAPHLYTENGNCPKENTTVVSKDGVLKLWISQLFRWRPSIPSDTDSPCSCSWPGAMPTLKSKESKAKNGMYIFWHLGHMASNISLQEQCFTCLFWEVLEQSLILEQKQGLKHVGLSKKWCTCSWLVTLMMIVVSIHFEVHDPSVASGGGKSHLESLKHAENTMALGIPKLALSSSWS